MNQEAVIRKRGEPSANAVAPEGENGCYLADQNVITCFGERPSSEGSSEREANAQLPHTGWIQNYLTRYARAQRPFNRQRCLGGNVSDTKRQCNRCQNHILRTLLADSRQYSNWAKEALLNKHRLPSNDPVMRSIILFTEKNALGNTRPARPSSSLIVCRERIVWQSLTTVGHWSPLFQGPFCFHEIATVRREGAIFLA